MYVIGLIIEKIKMIDNYQRNMKILDEAFNTIK
jgi:hypothetical protein